MSDLSQLPLAVGHMIGLGALGALGVWFALTAPFPR